MTLFERLSRLTLRQVEKLFGTSIKKLLHEGGLREIDIASQVTLSSNLFRLTLPDALVSIVDDDRSVDKMRFICSVCNHTCEHIGAALALILEEKMGLGLSVRSKQEIVPAELTEEELVRRELLRRHDRASKERFTLKSTEPKKIWTDYIITSHESGKSYRVALRGWQQGESYCTCPDYRKNTLGTCKHILHTIAKVRKQFPSWNKEPPFIPTSLAAYLKHGRQPELRLQVPEKIDESIRTKLKRYLNAPITDYAGFMKMISYMTSRNIEILLYPDAEEYLTLQLHRISFSSLVSEIRNDPKNHPLRTTLLKTELLPYQLDGIAFAAGMGRAVLADDMGLGKTIQGIGMAQLLAQRCGISRVLIVCPASVKAQWRNEISRFCDRAVTIVAGSAKERFQNYRNGAFFTICNYEQVLRDLEPIETTDWDLIILDEGQRIKNWEAKTSRTIKGLRSRYALVLSGTPLENRLEELYWVMEFIDDRRFGPDFRFEHHYRVSDSKGRLLGYKNLDTLRKAIQPVLLRRTRDSVMKQLPARTTDIVRIEPTGEQMDIHDSSLKVINQIVGKSFLTEMDLLRLQKLLLICRMVADSTTLVDKKEPGFSTKLERLAELLPQLAAEKGRKVLLFSEWTTMLDLIEKRVLNPAGITYVRLDGSVPQRFRQTLVNRFQTDDSCTFFITTNAGSTGLNLQAANTVVNVDLPWNPAVLEQRIGRAHRMGQKRPVHVYLMVTEGTLEEKMLSTLAMKKDLSLAALDPDSDVTTVNLRAGIDELKKRLELLLGEKQKTPLDESQRQRVEAEALAMHQRKTVQQAGGDLIMATFSFLKAFIPNASEPNAETVDSLRTGLQQCFQTEEDGTVRMKLRLPSAAAVDELARSMASFSSIVSNKT